MNTKKMKEWYLRGRFIQLGEAKLIEGIFIGLQIIKVICNPTFEVKLNLKE